jgi:hypothetical protein
MPLTLETHVSREKAATIKVNRSMVKVTGIAFFGKQMAALALTIVYGPES